MDYFYLFRWYSHKIKDHMGRHYSIYKYKLDENQPQNKFIKELSL